MKVLLVFSEGPHDVAFIKLVLELCCNIKHISSAKISDFPAPLNAIFSQLLKNHAMGDLSLDMAHKFMLPNYVFKTDTHCIMLFNTGGMNKYINVKRIISQIIQTIRTKDSSFDFLETDLIYLFTYDTDYHSPEERIEEMKRKLFPITENDAYQVLVDKGLSVSFDDTDILIDDNMILLVKEDALQFEYNNKVFDVYHDSVYKDNFEIICNSYPYLASDVTFGSTNDNIEGNDIAGLYIKQKEYSLDDEINIVFGIGHFKDTNVNNYSISYTIFNNTSSIMASKAILLKLDDYNNDKYSIKYSQVDEEFVCEANYKLSCNFQDVLNKYSSGIIQFKFEGEDTIIYNLKFNVQDGMIYFSVDE